MSVKPKKRGGSLLVRPLSIAFVFIVAITSTLIVPSVANAAPGVGSNASANQDVSFSANDILLNSGAPVALGSPVGVGDPVVVGQLFGEAGWCIPGLTECSWAKAGNSGMFASCLFSVANPIFWAAALTACDGALANGAATFEEVILSPGARIVMEGIAETASLATISTIQLVLGELHSDNPLKMGQIPVDCNVATGGTGKTCATAPDADDWFLGQFAVMRNIGIFMLVPFIMIMLIQAIVRGSLFFMLRSMLVMLPVAVIASVGVVTMTQLMLNISDSISDAMVNNLTDLNGYGGYLTQQIGNIAVGGLGPILFFILLMLFTIFSLIAIYVELLLRQIGVYLSLLFLPLAFAGLVWPATTRWARRLIELLMGLIFSKVVIVAALGLGLAALSAGDGFAPLELDDEPGLSLTAPLPTPDDVTTGEELSQDLIADRENKVLAGLSALLVGASLVATAAFAGYRLVEVALGSTAATRVTRPSGIIPMGGTTANFLGALNRGLGRHAQNQAQPGPPPGRWQTAQPPPAPPPPPPPPPP